MSKYEIVQEKKRKCEEGVLFSKHLTCPINFSNVIGNTNLISCTFTWFRCLVNGLIIWPTPPGRLRKWLNLWRNTLTVFDALKRNKFVIPVCHRLINSIYTSFGYSQVKLYRFNSSLGHIVVWMKSITFSILPKSYFMNMFLYFETRCFIVFFFLMYMVHKYLYFHACRWLNSKYR